MIGPVATTAIANFKDCDGIADMDTLEADEILDIASVEESILYSKY